MARSGVIPSRTQSCVAVGDHDNGWFLINASSDLSLQLQACPDLHPSLASPRNTPIKGVLLTNADLDHLLGVFSLREGAEFQIYATPAVRAVAEEVLGLDTVLLSFCKPEWREPDFNEFMPLGEERDAQWVFRAIELPGKPPPFARHNCETPPLGHSIAYQVWNRQTDKKLLIAPDVAAITGPLDHALRTSHIILFDGTFWSGDELAAVRPGAKAAGEMGHVPIRDGSLPVLAQMAAPTKIYIHLNNTNPILDPSSAERAAVERAGIQVGVDGMELRL